MDFKEISILKFYELIEADYDHTQRSISKLLGISLGNVNKMIKDLAAVGDIEIQKNSKNRVRYLLSEKGYGEKVKLTHKYMSFLLTFFNDIKERIQSVYDELNQQNAHSIVFYGVGDFAELAFVLLQKTSLELIGVIDPNEFGHQFYGMPILHPSQVSKLLYDKIVITSFDVQKNVEQIAATLKVPITKFKTINKEYNLRQRVPNDEFGSK